MKKFTFVLMLMLAYAGFTMAQTIENFESIQMNIFSSGATGSISVVPNPDPTGANTSLYVGKMVRGFSGADPWAGWYSTIPVPINVTDNRYVHIKLWKPRVSPTCFKVEGGAGDSGDTYPMTEYSNVGHWEEVVYDMTTSPNTPKPSGEYVKIVLIPDFLTPINLTEDITIYYDDMYVNNDPAVGSAPVTMIENFEVIPMNMMLNETTPPTDLSSVTVVPNPSKSGVNLSNSVVKFSRDKDGWPWDGFWSKVADYSSAVDVTTNKYVHAKVWKPVVSVVKFKLEGGPDGTKEIESMYPQTKINEWEDMVFDFSSMSGAYPIIAFMPDFAENLTEDRIVYFDDIVLNNDPNPEAPPTQRIQVDMNGANLTPGQQVFISGAFGNEVNGTWAQPGSLPANEMVQDGTTGIYFVDLHLASGVYEFKFFKDANWNTGDPFNNRTATFTGNANLVYTWGVGGVETSIRDNKQAGKIQMYPNPVRNELTVNTTSDISKVIITNTLGKVVGNLLYTNKTINTSNLSKGMYFVTFINADGTKVTQKLIKD
jgi:hypothetical protein